MSTAGAFVAALAIALTLWFIVESVRGYRSLGRLLRGIWYTEGASVQTLVDKGFASDIQDAEKILDRLVEENLVQIISGSQSPKIYGLVHEVKEMHDSAFQLWVRR